MGIDHSNPYIHSTTVLCDNVMLLVSFLHLYQVQHPYEPAVVVVG